MVGTTTLSVAPGVVELVVVGSGEVDVGGNLATEELCVDSVVEELITVAWRETGP